MLDLLAQIERPLNWVVDRVPPLKWANKHSDAILLVLILAAIAVNFIPR